MPKSSKRKPVRLSTMIHTARINQWIKRYGRKLIDGAKPYLIPKYWPIYLLSFGLGLYLWGPGHGLEKFKHWKTNQEQRTAKSSTVETLRHELKLLKQQLQIEQSKKPEPVFNPHNFSRPALGRVVRGFTWTNSQKSWRLHPGVDISMPAAGNIMAAAAGTVSKVEKTPAGSFSVTIDHGNGWESVYAGITDIQVQQGQKIIKGVIIGTAISGPGSQEAVFHFRIYHNRQPVDPTIIIEGL